MTHTWRTCIWDLYVGPITDSHFLQVQLDNSLKVKLDCGELLSINRLAAATIDVLFLLNCNNKREV